MILKHAVLIKLFSLSCVMLLTACQSHLTKIYGYTNLVSEKSINKTLVFAIPKRTSIDRYTKMYSEPYSLSITFLSKIKTESEVKLRVKQIKFDGVPIEIPRYRFTQIISKSDYHGTEYPYEAEFELANLYTTHKPIELEFNIFYSGQDNHHKVVLEPIYSEKESNPHLDGIRREFW